MKGRLTQMSNYESVGTDLCTSGLERPRQFPVVRLEISQLEFLAAVLNHAFQNEPHFKYLLPDEQTRHRSSVTPSGAPCFNRCCRERIRMAFHAISRLSGRETYFFMRTAAFELKGLEGFLGVDRIFWRW